MKNLGMVGNISLLLVVVGALNWGLYGAFEMDLVATVFGEMTTLSKVVYVLVGLGGVYMIYDYFMGDK